MKELEQCPICGSSYLTISPNIGIGPVITTNLWGIERLQLGVVTRYSRCKACEVLFQNPRPSDIELLNYYTDGTYRGNLNLSTDQIDTDEMWRARRVATLLLDGRSYRSHLDIGCSRGFLLREVEAEVRHGVELNPNWTTEKVEVTPDVPNGKFELVTIVHTLEHEPRPVDMLKKAWAALDDGGTMYVEVPGNLKDGLRLPHLYYWTAASLTFTAAIAGITWPGVVKMSEPHLGIIFSKEAKCSQ